MPNKSRSRPAEDGTARECDHAGEADRVESAPPLCHRQACPCGIADQEVDRLRILLELRHTRLRLEMVVAEIDYAVVTLDQGWISPQGALGILNDAVDDFLGGGA